MARQRNTPLPPEEKPEDSGLVKMVRESVDGPSTADVHPDEVQNFKRGGWVEA